jgi:hypothetical protein
MELSVVWGGNKEACDADEAKQANAAISVAVRVANRIPFVIRWSGFILRALDKKCNVPGIRQRTVGREFSQRPYPF